MKELIQRLRVKALVLRKHATADGVAIDLLPRAIAMEPGEDRDALDEANESFAQWAGRQANHALDLEAAADALERLSACPHCNGDGWIVKMGKGRMDCPQCDGTGKSEVMRHDP